MVTIIKAEVKTTKTGKSYKAVELSNGIKASMWPTGTDRNPTPGYDQAVTGSTGDAEITTQDQGGKTYHNMISWVSTGGASASVSHDSGGPDWPAKDRGMDAQSAYKSAAPIVAELVKAGAVKTHEDALKAWEFLAVAAYGAMQQARKNDLAHDGYDPFAE